MCQMHTYNDLTTRCCCDFAISENDIAMRLCSWSCLGNNPNDIICMHLRNKRFLQTDFGHILNTIWKRKIRTTGCAKHKVVWFTWKLRVLSELSLDLQHTMWLLYTIHSFTLIYSGVLCCQATTMISRYLGNWGKRAPDTYIIQIIINHYKWYY